MTHGARIQATTRQETTLKIHKSSLPDLPRNLEDFIAKRRTAVVLWDLQNGLAGKAYNVDEVRQNALRLIEAADNVGVPVIWSRHILPLIEYTTGPFLLFLMKKQKVDDIALLKPTMQPGMPDTDFLEGLKPAPHHIVLEKSQPSLFVDTPLDLRLKTLKVETVIFAGVATDIGIEFNARHAASYGYYPVVAADACGAYSTESHERSLSFLQSWITPVVTTSEICDVWASHSKI
ncbi:cysteine hydrolase family protein [Pararhizobium polonicum]|uniref:cysteine hydrolase family protein n=1 Tax=Pararhizobium polonicum TaxID=1612624 RepID=UPI0013148859|nr:isochorismatase family cysteine hydrolase [Pararhizobium polonicum]